MLTRIQVGFLELPEPESDTFYRIMKLWIKDCDTHLGCGGLSYSFPTRLIDVGTLDTPVLRLVEKELVRSKRCIALSHPWGDITRYKPFCTLPETSTFTKTVFQGAIFQPRSETL